MKKELEDYCNAPMGVCTSFESCEECKSTHRERAMKRKKEENNDS